MKDGMRRGVFQAVLEVTQAVASVEGNNGTCLSRALLLNQARCAPPGDLPKRAMVSREFAMRRRDPRLAFAIG